MKKKAYAQKRINKISPETSLSSGLWDSETVILLWGLAISIEISKKRKAPATTTARIKWIQTSEIQLDDMPRAIIQGFR
jgi:hypothetical protein